MSKTTEQLASEFLSEIQTAIDKNAKAYSKDAFCYQFIVVLSAVCGLLSLIIGTATKNAVAAGGLWRCNYDRVFSDANAALPESARLAGSHESRIGRHPCSIHLRT